MNRTRKAFYNTLTAFLHIVVNQLISLTVSIKVLEFYGPDYHGLNAILSNVMIWFLVLEGGLTTASTVALYKPYMSQDFDRCNQILSASKQQFQKIGNFIFLIGLLCAWIYPLFLKTPVPYWQVGVIFSIMSLATAFGIFYTRKYSIMYTVTQHEYILQAVNIGFAIVSNLIVLLVTISHFHYIWVRVIYLVSTVFSGCCIARIILSKYRFINFQVAPALEAIHGTKDVIAQKITGIFRTSLPALYIATFLGTSFASVYAVNLYSYNFVRNIMTNIYTSTQSGIGQIVAERDSSEVYKVFRIFEYIGISMLLFFMSTAVVMTLPFIRYYTRNAPGNIQYVNYWLWIIIALNVTIQMLHIPSGIIINMNAKFKEDKIFQISSIIVMLVSMSIFGYFLRLEGIMLGVTCGSLALCLCELIYARKNIFQKGYLDFLRPLSIDLLLLLPIMYLEIRFFPKVITIPTFCLFASLAAINHGIALILVNYFIERERLKQAFARFSKLIFHKVSPKSANA